MLNNLRSGWRMLTKSLGFTLISAIVLALGIGANTTIFSIINTVLLKPVMARHPERLVGVYQHERDNPQQFNFFSYPDFADLRAGKEAAFDDLFAIGLPSAAWKADLTEKISTCPVSANFFSALGVAPAMGRWFLPEEETSGTPVAVLTAAFWKRLGGDRSIVGRPLKLTRGEVIVVGVMPAGFTGTQLLAPDMFVPIGTADTLTSNPNLNQPPRRILTDRGDRRFMVMGRLRPGLTLANLSGALAVLDQRFPIPDPQERKARTLVCTAPARFSFSNQPPQGIGELASLGSLAFGLSTLVLFIACLNLANMMLARGSARRKEIAIRLALGAGGRRILGQLLTEGFLLSLLGGAGGLLVSMWATHLLAAFLDSGGGMPPDFPKLNFAPDWRVLVTLLFLSGLATLFFSLGPGLKLARLDVNSDLKRHAGEDAHEPRRSRLGTRKLVAIGQIALALALLVAAVLFSRSAMNVVRADPGFRFGSNFYLSLDPSTTGYPERRMPELIRAAADRLSALPGVESVSPAMYIPFGDQDMSRGVQLAGAPKASSAAASLTDGGSLEAKYNVVGADYFRTLGIPLRQGREFNRNEAEGSNSARVAIVSQNLAEQLWPGQDPLGRSIQFPSEAAEGLPVVMAVVGVVPQIDWDVFEKRHPAGVYVPFGQDFHADVKLHVRVAAGIDPAGIMKAAREELRRLDAQVPLTEVKTLQAMHRDGLLVRVTRLGSVLFGAFGALAVSLSLLGVYGLKAYEVSRRTREIGIRMALGASRYDVQAMILRESLWLVALGLGLGLGLAIAVGKLAAQFLVGVAALDPSIFIMSPLLLLSVILVACYFPARRAANVDPLVAFRQE
jgi:predicted permease